MVKHCMCFKEDLHRQGELTWNVSILGKDMQARQNVPISQSKNLLMHHEFERQQLVINVVLVAPTKNVASAVTPV